MKRGMTLILALILMTACEAFDRYASDFVSYQVIANDSILGVSGNWDDNDAIIETDDYGRVLYAFLGSTALYEGRVLSLGIAQSTTKTHSYFYDGVNEIHLEYPEGLKKDIKTIKIEDYFDIDKINQLKIDNDWNKPLDPSRFFEVDFETVKEKPISDTILKKVYEPLSEKINSCTLLTWDKNGLMLYFMIGIEYDDKLKKNTYGPAYLVMFDKDKKVIPQTGIQQLDVSLFDDYRAVLNAFKQANGWSFY